MFWTEKDIWQYIKYRKLKISRLYSMGYQRNGCMYCGFGVQHEYPNNRIQLLSLTHPKAYQVFLDNYAKYFDMAEIEYKNVQLRIPV